MFKGYIYSPYFDCHIDLVQIDVRTKIQLPNTDCQHFTEISGIADIDTVQYYTLCNKDEKHLFVIIQHNDTWYDIIREKYEQYYTGLGAVHLQKIHNNNYYLVNKSCFTRPNSLQIDTHCEYQNIYCTYGGICYYPRLIKKRTIRFFSVAIDIIANETAQFVWRVYT